MIIIEFMSPRGHVEINSFFIKNIMGDGDSLIIGESLINEYKQFNPIAFNDLSGSKISRLKNTLRGIRKINTYQKNDKEGLIILSYDIIFIFLLKFLLNGYGKKNIYSFIHNGYPSSFLKLLLLSLIKREVTFIAFSELVSNSIRLKGFKSISIKLPMLRPSVNSNVKNIDELLKKSKRFKGIVYCASGSTPQCEIEKFAIKYNEYLIVVKMNFSTKLNNITFIVDYNGYGKMIEICDYVYIYFPYEYRESGVFYDAMSFNKKIIVNDGPFGLSSIDIYPDNVSLKIEDFEEKDSYYDCNRYNEKIIESLQLLRK